jgi:hypothetical protein
MKRTPSELQLREDEELADFRDYVMFTRIVGRLARQQGETKDYKLRQANDMCLAHIISTRNSSQETGAVLLKAAQQRWLNETPTESLQRNPYLPNQQMLADIQDMLLDEDDEDVTMFNLDL